MTVFLNSGEPDTKEITPFARVFTSAAMITAMAATFSDSWMVETKREILSVMAFTSVMPATKLTRYTPDEPRNRWAISTTIETTAYNSPNLIAVDNFNGLVIVNSG